MSCCLFNYIDLIQPILFIPDFQSRSSAKEISFYPGNKKRSFATGPLVFHPFQGMMKKDLRFFNRDSEKMGQFQSLKSSHNSPLQIGKVKADACNL